MPDRALCRIGVFYDGSYFSYAQLHYYAVLFRQPDKAESLSE